MRVFKFMVNALVLFVVLPVTIVAVLGLLFSPLQMTARANEPAVVLEANDVPMPTEEVSNALGMGGGAAALVFAYAHIAR